MRRFEHAVPACVAILVASSGAYAEEEGPLARSTSPLAAERGLQIGARLGYSLPMGSNGGNSNTAMSDLETAIVPIGVDVGYRLSPRVYVGGTAAWGPGTAPTNASPCNNSGVSCFRQDVQLRGEVRAYLAPYGTVGWWLAAGAGYELATFAQSAGGSTITATRTGPVFPDLQIGFDVRGGATAVGPYFGVQVASFVTQGVNPAAEPVSTWIDDRAVHTWFTFGVRGSYGPW